MNQLMDPTQFLPRFTPGVLPVRAGAVPLPPPGGGLTAAAPAPAPAPVPAVPAPAAAPLQMTWDRALREGPGDDLSGAMSNFGQGNVLPGVGGLLRAAAGVPGMIVGEAGGVGRAVAPAVAGLAQGLFTPGGAAPAPAPAPTQGVRAPVPPVPAGLMDPNVTPGTVGAPATPVTGHFGMPGQAQAAPAAQGGPITVVRAGHVSQEGGDGTGRLMTPREAQVILGAVSPRMSPIDAARAQVYSVGTGQLHEGLIQSEKTYQEALALAGNDPAKQKAANDEFLNNKARIRDAFLAHMNRIGLTPALTLEEMQRQTQGMPEPE